MTSLNGRAVRIALVTVSVLLAGALTVVRADAQVFRCPDPNDSNCVSLTFNANVQLTNLHPAVSHVQLFCKAQNVIYGNTGSGESKAVVNRSYTGVLSSRVGIPKYTLEDPAARTLAAECQLVLIKGGNTPAQTSADAVASAAQPVLLTDGNWAVVASGSTIKWTQSVTFPNATP
jgi:hypothetical protein